MSKLISGIHHVAMKCADMEEFEKAKDFYGRVLGLEQLREWPAGVMFDSGSGYIEIFNSGKAAASTGTINHFAFYTNDPDACVKTVKENGYEVFVEPKNVVLASQPPLPIRVAFCRGPVGEEIEFFSERS